MTEKEQELLANWEKGKKRTCEKCKLTFVTRGDFHIHQMQKHTGPKCMREGE